MFHRLFRFVPAVALVVAILTMLTAPHASAGEGAFGWVYTLDLQPKGEWEFEQRVQLNQNQASGTYQAWYSRTELEYGLTNDIQLAAYVNASKISAQGNYRTCALADDATACPYTAGFGVNAPPNGNPFSRTKYDGVSLEGIWRITNPVTSPIGIGLYIEPTFGPTTDSIEGRILLQSNFLDDKLVLAANLVAESAYMGWLSPQYGGPILESEIDALFGVSYRFAPKWTGGLEARQHNDFMGQRFNTPTQHAWFVGPNLHYADKDWWVTMAYRRQLNGSVCLNGGQVECSNGYAWDNHTMNEYLLKVGIPF